MCFWTIQPVNSELKPALSYHSLTYHSEKPPFDHVSESNNWSNNQASETLSYPINQEMLKMILFLDSAIKTDSNGPCEQCTVWPQLYSTHHPNFPMACFIQKVHWTLSYLPGLWRGWSIYNGSTGCSHVIMWGGHGSIVTQPWHSNSVERLVLLISAWCLLGWRSGLSISSSDVNCWVGKTWEGWEGMGGEGKEFTMCRKKNLKKHCWWVFHGSVIVELVIWKSLL